jgi:hypothetical protein
MHTHDYVLECHVRHVLDEARAAAARAALIPRRAPTLRPMITATLSAVRTLCARATSPHRLAPRPR